MSTALAFLPAGPLPAPTRTHRRLHPRNRPLTHRVPTSCASNPAPPKHHLETRAAQLNFLRTVWGKRPLLIRNFLPQCANLLSREEVLDLAAHPTVPSRLIETHDPSASPPYSLTLGPFERADFEQLPPRDWTVLVQGVDRVVPPVADLLDAVAFLPNWRLDDVQLSYATRGGGVGPHVDNYDVFLVQGHGRRRWAVSNMPVPAAAEAIVDDCDVRVLRDAFVPDAEWLLEPGDALYVPPRFPHHGVCASDDCATFSIGFRAPTAAHLLASWLEQVIADDALHTVFLADDAADLASHAGDRGRVSAAAANRAYDMIRDALRDDRAMRRRFVDWFAAEVSQQKVMLDDGSFDDEPMGEDEVDALLDDAMKADDRTETWSVMRHREGSVFAYYEHGARDVAVYVDGQKWDVESVEIARAICNERRITAKSYAEAAERFPSLRAVVRELLLEGYLYFER